jgi:hypothetical protein
MGESRIRTVAGFSLLVLVVLTTAACASGSGGTSGAGGKPSGDGSHAFAPLSDVGQPAPWDSTARLRKPDARPQAQPRRPEVAPDEDLASQPPRAIATGPHLRVIWEALTVERARFRNPTIRDPRFNQRSRAGILHTQKIVLVSESHPEAKANLKGRAVRENKGIAVAAIADAELARFVQGLERQGFFRLARPTAGVEPLFDSETARGRVTVERDGQSYTLLSMRGQGLNDATKQIPPMYSQAKQSILWLRNQTPTMRVVGASRDPLAR